MASTPAREEVAEFSYRCSLRLQRGFEGKRGLWERGWTLFGGVAGRAGVFGGNGSFSLDGGVGF